MHLGSLREIWNYKKDVFTRNSKRGEIDRECQILLNRTGEVRRFICNGNRKGDADDEKTFIGKEKTVKDYILSEARIWELMVGIEFGN